MKYTIVFVCFSESLTKDICYFLPYYFSEDMILGFRSCLEVLIGEVKKMGKDLVFRKSKILNDLINNIEFLRNRPRYNKVTIFNDNFQGSGKCRRVSLISPI
ncbi:hypothetical protein D3C84_828810 [compost metagenome]